MTCTANATKIAKPVNAARMMYVLVLKLTALRSLSDDLGEATSGSARSQSRVDD
jgi:hypothetical protein